MSIIKSKHAGNYTVLPNDIFKSELSIEAIGLLCYFLSLPSDWVIYKTQLHSQLNIGRDKVDRIFKELQNKGYVLSVKNHSKTGRIEYEHIVYDKPYNGEPQQESPLTEKPATANTALLNTNILNTEILSNKEVNNIAETEVSASEPIFSLHTNCVEYWCKDVKPDYVFTGKDAKHIKELYGKVKQMMLRKKSDAEISDISVFDAFKLFCSNIKNVDKFYHKMDIAGINSQFNPISEQIRDYLLSSKSKSNVLRVKTRDDFFNEEQYKNYCLKNNLEYNPNE